MKCPNCGFENDGNNFCSNCGTSLKEFNSLGNTENSITNQVNKKAAKPFYKKWWFWVLSIFALLIILIIAAGNNEEKTPEEAANDINQQIDTSTPTPKPEDSITATEVTVTDTPKPEPQEINPDIPLGTTYTLNQGEYECGVDIPAGRYAVEWENGNQFGGSITALNGAKYLDKYVSIEPGETYTCILSSGDTFEISLASMKFTKISSLPNDNYLQEDGSYILGSGYFFEGIDIPSGKYNVTAVGGNQFGITISTKSKSFLSLDQDETYNNLSLNNGAGSLIEISLGEAKFVPVD